MKSRRLRNFIFCFGILNLSWASFAIGTSGGYSSDAFKRGATPAPTAKQCEAAAKNAEKIATDAQSEGNAKAAEFRAKSAAALNNTTNNTLSGASGALGQTSAGLTAIGGLCAEKVQGELKKCDRADPSVAIAIKKIEDSMKICKTIVDPALGTAMQAQNIGNAATQIGQAPSSEGGTGWLPGLIGAGLGAAAISMFGGGEDASSLSKESEGSPPSLAAAPAAASEAAAAETPVAKAAIKQATDSISKPAVVVVPTVEKGTEAGSGDNEILLAASGAIPDPDVLTPVAGNDSSPSSDSAGGDSATIGGTTGNESQLDSSALASQNKSESSGHSDKDSSDSTAQALASDQGADTANRPAPFMMFGQSSESSEGSGGSGSGMLNGVPSRFKSTSKRALAGSSVSSASSSSVSSSSSVAKVAVTNKKNSSSSSSVSAASLAEKRNFILDTLRAMGLIGGRSTAPSFPRK